ncbi:hypothetical protein ACFQVD_09655 [Streptosporangium amethystogenes subsp. fukuiense]|uniref:Uncharacterized protein n=1 Tax=Streptosporangium amethystogenes subsp. fukuiense TaxID=698418 RepID=A0ABW2SWA5_9ACTN
MLTKEPLIVLRRLEAACHAGYGFRAITGLYAGTGPDQPFVLELPRG